MKELAELISTDLGTLQWLQKAVETSPIECSVLPRSDAQNQVLLASQVSSNSIIGTLAYHTGGVLILSGCLRLLGSGNPLIPRDLATWNEFRSKGLYLVADDVVGGFFAINGGALGADIGKLYYWSSDDLYWEPLEMEYSEFVSTMLAGHATKFYKDLLWENWENDIKSLKPEECFNFYPPLWTKEGALSGSFRSSVPVTEAFDSKLEIYNQLANEDS